MSVTVSPITSLLDSSNVEIAGAIRVVKKLIFPVGHEFAGKVLYVALVDDASIYFGTDLTKPVYPLQSAAPLDGSTPGIVVTGFDLFFAQWGSPFPVLTVYCRNPPLNAQFPNSGTAMVCVFGFTWFPSDITSFSPTLVRQYDYMMGVGTWNFTPVPPLDFVGYYGPTKPNTAMGFSLGWGWWQEDFATITNGENYTYNAIHESSAGHLVEAPTLHFYNQGDFRGIGISYMSMAQHKDSERTMAYIQPFSPMLGYNPAYVWGDYMRCRLVAYGFNVEGAFVSGDHDDYLKFRDIHRGSGIITIPLNNNDSSYASWAFEDGVGVTAGSNVSLKSVIASMCPDFVALAIGLGGQLAPSLVLGGYGIVRVLGSGAGFQSFSNPDGRALIDYICAGYTSSMEDPHNMWTSTSVVGNSGVLLVSDHYLYRSMTALDFGPATIIQIMTPGQLAGYNRDVLANGTTIRFLTNDYTTMPNYDPGWLVLHTYHTTGYASNVIGTCDGPVMLEVFHVQRDGSGVTQEGSLTLNLYDVAVAYANDTYGTYDSVCSGAPIGEGAEVAARVITPAMAVVGVFFVIIIGSTYHNIEVQAITGGNGGPWETRVIAHDRCLGYKPDTSRVETDSPDAYLFYGSTPSYSGTTPGYMVVSAQGRGEDITVSVEPFVSGIGANLAEWSGVDALVGADGRLHPDTYRLLWGGSAYSVVCVKRTAPGWSLFYTPEMVPIPAYEKLFVPSTFSSPSTLSELTGNEPHTDTLMLEGFSIAFSVSDPEHGTIAFLRSPLGSVGHVMFSDATLASTFNQPAPSTGISMRQYFVPEQLNGVNLFQFLGFFVTSVYVDSEGNDGSSAHTIYVTSDKGVIYKFAPDSLTLTQVSNYFAGAVDLRLTKVGSVWVVLHQGSDNPFGFTAPGYYTSTDFLSWSIASAPGEVTTSPMDSSVLSLIPLGNGLSRPLYIPGVDTNPNSIFRV